MTAALPAHELEQRGWNAGYLAAEHDRLALATALDNCRTELHLAVEEVERLERYIRRLEYEQDKARTA